MESGGPRRPWSIHSTVTSTNKHRSSSATIDFHNGLPRTRSCVKSGRELMKPAGMSGPVEKSEMRCQSVMSRSSSSTGSASTCLRHPGRPWTVLGVSTQLPVRSPSASGRMVILVGPRQCPLGQLVVGHHVGVGDLLRVRLRDAQQDVARARKLASTTSSCDAAGTSVRSSSSRVYCSTSM